MCSACRFRTSQHLSAHTFAPLTTFTLALRSCLQIQNITTSFSTYIHTFDNLHTGTSSITKASQRTRFSTSFAIGSSVAIESSLQSPYKQPHPFVPYCSLITTTRVQSRLTFLFIQFFKRCSQNVCDTNNR